MMVNFHTYVFVLCAVAALGFNFGQANDERINNYLVEHLSDDDTVEINLEIAKNWLEVQKTKDFYFGKGLIKDLTIFTALAELQAEQRCDMDAYGILMQNIEMIKVDLRNTNPDRRIERIWRQVAEKHADDCDSVYESQLSHKLEQMDKELVHRAEAFAAEPSQNFLTTYYRGSHLRMGELTCRDYVGKSRQSAYNALVELTEGDPDAKYLEVTVDENPDTTLVRKEKLKQLFKRYLVDSCRYYQGELEQIFLPAQLDARIKSDRVDKGANFYEHWASYRICGCLVRYELNQDFYNELANHRKSLE